MPTTFSTPTTYAGTGATAGPAVDWVNPGNITSSDNAYATALLQPGVDTIRISDYLRADNFNFNISARATIVGIICYVERKASAASAIKDYNVNLLKAGFIPSGSDDKKDTSIFWSTTEGTVDYGSPTDLWNSTWTPSDINDPDTGFGIRCEYIPAYNSATASVDSMSMVIYYEVDGMYYGQTAIKRAYYGTTEIKNIYYGSTIISS